MVPRFRFAPSPTGGLHIGTARTALFNWLAARGMNGKFILRIEDTDVKRSNREHEKSIVNDLKWLGLGWDEFYRQSERIKKYQEFAGRLLKEKKAYRCFCSPARLEKLRASQYASGKISKYDNRCRSLGEDEIKKNLSEGKRFTIRFKVDDDNEIIFNDLARGKIRFKSDVIGDFIIIKSDGTPSYNFAVVVDDGDMKITHVIRGEDHLTNTARQVLLFKSLGFNLPYFAHLSMILGEDGSKLSKRHGATTITQFREGGYLAEALANYLSMLSWSPGEGREVFGINDVGGRFKISDISKSPAVFDINKLKWFNGIHMRRKTAGELVELCLPFLIREKVISKRDIKNKAVMDKIYRGVKSFKDNLKVLSDFPGYIKDYLTEKITKYSGEAVEILRVGTSKIVIENFLEELENEGKTFDNIKDMDLNEEKSKNLINGIKEKSKGLKIKGKYLYMPIRVSVTGKTHGPELPGVISMLGAETCIQRARQTLEYIKRNI
ncbi:MAG: glutamate--tRNA ligase [Actinomycetota bacterium]|nr:glutamate--tRNA ligase [Actinomycetota bacterium]